MDKAVYTQDFVAQSLGHLQACAWSTAPRRKGIELHEPVPHELLELRRAGEHWLQRVFPCDLARVEAWFSACAESKVPVHPIEYRLVTEGSGIVWVRQWLDGKVRGRSLCGLIAVVSAQKQLEAECLRICERERTSIGQELHDDICQLMAGLSCMLDVLGKQISKVRPDLHSQLDELSSQIHHGMERTRVLAHGLVPAKLVNMGLERALAELARQTEVARQVKVLVQCSPRLPSHSPEQNLHLYRIAQEAVSNGIRHGHATEIQITLKRVKGRLRLSIRDNGTGMVAQSERPQGIGMHVMQFRAGILGATLSVHSSKGKGVLVEVDYACSHNDIKPPAPQP